MDIDTQRRIDAWIGVPACAILSIHAALRRRPPRAIRKIALLQLSEMGSAVHACAALERLRDRHPHAELYYVIFAELSEAVEMLGLVPDRNIIRIRSGRAGEMLGDTARAIARLRRERVDAVVDLELFARFSAALSYLSGAATRVGFDRLAMEGLYRGRLATRRVGYNHTAPIGVNFLALAHAVDAAPGVPAVKLELTRRDLRLPTVPPDSARLEAMRRRLDSAGVRDGERIVVLNPNASRLLPLRRWPLANYIDLARRLAALPGIRLVVTGVDEDRPDARAIREAVAGVIDLAGQTTVRDLLDLFRLSSLLVSNDSGPPNVASLTKMPAIVLFGPETPLCYAPIGANIHVLYAGLSCSPCVSAYSHRASLCTDNVCLQAIGVDQVYALARSLLDRRPPAD